ncbi:class I SAM-dependent methyltransferase [Plectonema radiosum NIES-515]|uniref:Class I SAM-dependent methyltransferase n=1 Tax=Plectonema radiosum NIES-515 TaxID=2986073 RepID=A0ABT3AY52_9CYAN|nr:class I SAM-dependent methyltransferase [Plectonema radiosum]MCV3214047.1 class I SAM-dependent methyltransferase [Plectonema radiosum NIES-515]
MKEINVVQKNYDEVADRYDEKVQSPELNVQYLNEVKKIFQKYNLQRGSILDVGCGTGLLSDFLSGDFEYTGVDVSAGMLQYASQRGYKTIHQTIEDALPEIENQSYDFVVSLGALLFVEDIQACLKHINRIARKAIVLGLDCATDELIQAIPMTMYDHSKVEVLNALEDYLILGWTYAPQSIPVNTRMIYIELV